MILFQTPSTKRGRGRPPKETIIGRGRGRPPKKVFGVFAASVVNGAGDSTVKKRGRPKKTLGGGAKYDTISGSEISEQVDITFELQWNTAWSHKQWQQKVILM